MTRIKATHFQVFRRLIISPIFLISLSVFETSALEETRIIYDKEGVPDYPSDAILKDLLYSGSFIPLIAGGGPNTVYREFGVVLAATSDVNNLACDVKVGIKQVPYQLSDKNGNLRNIVNVAGLYEQTISTLTCLYPNKPCKFDGDLSSGHKSICYQQNANVTMLTYDTNLKETNFTLPVSCDCYINSNGLS